MHFSNIICISLLRYHYNFFIGKNLPVYCTSISSVLFDNCYLHYIIYIFMIDTWCLFINQVKNNNNYNLY